ncbi:hypothetical protein BPY_17100 [Bifidobacterium psychraerophilum]|uniref:FAD:protein FMN transferase n=1 Tax=Bifidobacterium psychraerophilum TaxID=218140 RepID=UPI00310CEC87
MMTRNDVEVQGAGTGHDKPMLVHVLNVMNIPFTIMVKPWGAVPGDHHRDQTAIASATDAAVSQIDAFLRDVDMRFSPFKQESSVSAARRGEWSAMLRDREFREIYAKTALANTITHGAFDAYYQGHYDPTGLVKGWAIETAIARFLRPLLQPSVASVPHRTAQPSRDTDHRALAEAVAINAGGDIRTAVAQHSDYIWHIGIEDPEDTKALLGSCQIRDGGVATSGFSKRGAHIAHTTEDEVFTQLTVISDSVEDADLWATAGIAGGMHLWSTLVKEQGLTAVAVRGNGEVIRYSDGRLLDSNIPGPKVTTAPSNTAQSATAQIRETRGPSC